MLTGEFVAHTTIAMVTDKLRATDALGFLCWKVSRLASHHISRRFAEAGVGVTVEQWRVLIPLYKRPGLTQGQLGEILSQEKTGVSRLVGALEKHRLAYRESSKEDRRVKHVYITDAGRELYESTIQIVVECRSELEKGIDPEELAICKKVLWQIIEPTLAPEFQCKMAE